MKLGAKTNLLLKGLLILSIQTGLFSGPPPTKEAHCRNLQGPVDLVFSTAIDWFMDNQYVVRSVNQSMGLISFYKVAKWKGSYGNDHLVDLEGCLIVQSKSNTSSTARLLLNQKYIEAGSKGIAVAGIQTDCDEDYYRDVFTGLEQKISPSK